MKKILIIEDEPMLADMYVEKFEQAGFKVVTTREAELGLEVAKKEKPDLIILDMLLIKANGISFLEQLRKDPQVSQMPVVGFSNLDDPVIKKRAFALGVEDYLIKTNYTPQEIINRVKKILE
jgi:two-component system, OmpR family, alkaline phosphatase synthesis response regulator PhoP